MAWIHDDDLDAVRNRADIVDVVSEHVTLRRAGSDMMKGLCPFHDEKTPSFTVKPSAGVYKCHGCDAGGDVLRFVMEMDALTFTEAVEGLADRYGITLRKVTPPGQTTTGPGTRGTGASPRAGTGHASRKLVLDALAAAEDFYAAQLGTPDAAPGQQVLTGRGFTPEHATQFRVGWAPTNRTALYTALTGAGHHKETLHAAGLTRTHNGNTYDFFTGRLVWPIRDHAGRTVGFGARRVLDDDPLPSKYVNSPETAVFKKSRLLYGLDLARKEVAASGMVTVVEGYTDVMACHIAGETTAVATCGTAFGAEHADLLARFLRPGATGAVFCFDGDEAGRKAAARAFEQEERLGAPMWAATATAGMDPCETWQARGPEALAAVLATRTPLWRFVLGPVVDAHDLSTPAGRVNALEAAASLLSGVNNRILRDEYARAISGLVGVSPDDAVSALTRASRMRRRNEERDQARAKARQSAPTQADGAPTQAGPGQAETDAFAPPGQNTPPAQDTPQQEDRPIDVDAALQGPAVPPVPDPRAGAYAAERETLKAALAYPEGAAHILDLNLTEAFDHPWYRAVHHAMSCIRYKGDLRDWTAKVLELTSEPHLRDLLLSLTVERPHLTEPLTDQTAYLFVARLRELHAARYVAWVRVQMGRVDPASDEYQQLTVNLFDGERIRREWAEVAAGNVIVDTTPPGAHHADVEAPDSAGSSPATGPEDPDVNGGDDFDPWAALDDEDTTPTASHADTATA